MARRARATSAAASSSRRSSRSSTETTPDDIAERYWRLHLQAPEEWETEVLHAGRAVDSDR